MLQPCFIWFTPSSNVQDFAQGLALTTASGAQSVCIFSCSNNNYPNQQVDQLLQSLNISVFGAIYPMLIWQHQVVEHGTIMLGLTQPIDTIEFITPTQQTIEQMIESNTSLQKNSSFLMFYDSLMLATEGFIESLYEGLDHEITIVGGGAGNLDFVKQSCVYTSQGLLSDIIQLVALPSELNTGVGHGWEILDGPFLVSKANGHCLESLNYTPAFELYKKTIERLSRYRFEQQEFFDIAKHFPLGVENMNNEILVRDPILVGNQQALQCVGNIAENAMVYILKGDNDKLINSAAAAAKQAYQHNHNHHQQASTSFIFDCISRVLYLGDDFQSELLALLKNCGTEYMIGGLSLGEIANTRSGNIQLLNKSTVIGCMLPR